MNTVNNLFEKIVDKDNILLAIKNAARGKMNKREVVYALKHQEEIADKLSSEFSAGTWRPNQCHSIKIINDGVKLKKREIVCPAFINEQIVHHAIMNICKDIFMRRFYRYSCASIPGRGIEYAIKYIRKSLKDRKNTKYFTVMDIRKFFNNIKPSKVFRALRRIIRDKRLLILFSHILRANKVCLPDGEIIKRGVPIGFYTSPWFANILLTQVDNLIKSMGIKYYIRYNDDMLLISGNKRKLNRAVNVAEKRINSLGLSLKHTPQIHMLSKVKIKFIGTKISSNKITLSSKVFLRAIRTANKISKKNKISAYDAGRIVSYSGRLKHYDCYLAYRRYIASKVNLKQMRKIISKGATRKCLEKHTAKKNH